MIGSMNTMPQKSKMSPTAQEYFTPEGEYTGYVRSEPLYEQGHVDGAVTKEHTSKPGVSIGSAVASLGKIKRRLKDTMEQY